MWFLIANMLPLKSGEHGIKRLNCSCMKANTLGGHGKYFIMKDPGEVLKIRATYLKYLISGWAKTDYRVPSCLPEIIQEITTNILTTSLATFVQSAAQLAPQQHQQKTHQPDSSYSHEWGRLVPLDGMWDIAEGTRQQEPSQFFSKVPVPGLVTSAKDSDVRPYFLIIIKQRIIIMQMFNLSRKSCPCRGKSNFCHGNTDICRAI